MTHDPSGHALAEEAYAAGAVEPGDVVAPHFTIELRCVIAPLTVGDPRGNAELTASILATELMARSDVLECVYTVTGDE